MNDKCLILGCGSSLCELNTDIHIIGVNDCYKVKNRIDDLIVVDDNYTFNKDRLGIILHTPCDNFYTHIMYYNDFYGEKWKQIALGNRLHNGLPRINCYDELGRMVIDYSVTSVYVATIIALNKGYKHIGILGMDMNNLHYKDELLVDTKTDFGNLVKIGYDIRNLSKVSLVDTIPYQELNEFLNE